MSALDIDAVTRQYAPALRRAARRWGGPDHEDILSEMLLRLVRRAQEGADLEQEYQFAALRWRVMDASRAEWHTKHPEDKRAVWLPPLEFEWKDESRDEWMSARGCIQPWSPVQWREPSEMGEMLDDGWAPVIPREAGW